MNTTLDTDDLRERIARDTDGSFAAQLLRELVAASRRCAAEAEPALAAAFMAAANVVEQRAAHIK